MDWQARSSVAVDGQPAAKTEKCEFQGAWFRV